MTNYMTNFWQVFGYSTDDFIDLVSNFLDRRDDWDADKDLIYEEMDEFLIYDEDIWTIMIHYQKPEEADMQAATEEFTRDICSLIASTQE